MNTQTTPESGDLKTVMPAMGFLSDAWSYGIDAAQRGILFLDVLRQRNSTCC